MDSGGGFHWPVAILLCLGSRHHRCRPPRLLHTPTNVSEPHELVLARDNLPDHVRLFAGRHFMLHRRNSPSILGSVGVEAAVLFVLWMLYVGTVLRVRTDSAYPSLTRLRNDGP